MAEATEELVKVYLEQKGYLVTLLKKVEARTSKNSPRAEIDVVAVRNVSQKDGLPDRIAGEVKSYKPEPRHFKRLDQKLRQKYSYKSRTEYDRYKWVNNQEYRREILNALNREYGFKDFQYVLFCSDLSKKYEGEIRMFLQEENIGIVNHSEILKWLLKNQNNEYTDNQILQLIRLLKLNTKKVEF